MGHPNRLLELDGPDALPGAYAATPSADCGATPTNIEPSGRAQVRRVSQLSEWASGWT